MNKRVLFCLVPCLLYCNTAYAYLDPGTGSLLIQAIIGIITAIISGLVYFWTTLKNKITQIFKKNKKSATNNKEKKHEQE